MSTGHVAGKTAQNTKEKEECSGDTLRPISIFSNMNKECNGDALTGKPHKIYMSKKVHRTRSGQ